MSAAQAEAAQQVPGKQQRQQKPQRVDMLVLDLPWVYHWPKLLVWVLFELCHIAIAVGETLGENEGECLFRQRR